MKHLLSILLISSICLTQEMEVDGNLKVSGTIQSADSLQQQINSLLTIISQLEQRIAQLECQNTDIIPEGYCDCFFHTLDECGVCNGDTTSCQDCAGVPNGDNLFDNCGICDNDSSNDCVQDCEGNWGGELEYDVCGLCGGEATSENDCYVTDVDGNTYEIVRIGDQTWMAENLKTLSNRFCYDNVPDNCEIYGGLYCWQGALEACPSGWHLPSDAEWIILEEFIGMCPGEGSGCSLDYGQRGTNEAFQLRAQGTEYWNNDYGIDEWGFGAVGGGRRQPNNSYIYLKIDGEYWTSTNTTGHPVSRKFTNQHGGVYRDHTGPEKGFSVRCIRD